MEFREIQELFFTAYIKSQITIIYGRANWQNGGPVTLYKNDILIDETTDIKKTFIFEAEENDIIEIREHLSSIVIYSIEILARTVYKDIILTDNTSIIVKKNPIIIDDISLSWNNYLNSYEDKVSGLIQVNTVNQPITVEFSHFTDTNDKYIIHVGDSYSEPKKVNLPYPDLSVDTTPYNFSDSI